jgi:hypothetical protein
LVVKFAQTRGTMTDADSLLGAWKLMTNQFVFDDNAEIVNTYGSEPDGALVLSPDGYMVGLITSGGEAQRTNLQPTALLRGMLAYAGPYRIEGDHFITKVEIAWHPSWLGTEQVRQFRVESDRLFITTTPQTLPLHGNRLGRGVLLWRRA